MPGIASDAASHAMARSRSVSADGRASSILIEIGKRRRLARDSARRAGRKTGLPARLSPSPPRARPAPPGPCRKDRWRRRRPGACRGRPQAHRARFLPLHALQFAQPHVDRHALAHGDRGFGGVSAGLSWRGREGRRGRRGNRRRKASRLHGRFGRAGATEPGVAGLRAAAPAPPRSAPRRSAGRTSQVRPMPTTRPALSVPVCRPIACKMRPPVKESPAACSSHSGVASDQQRQDRQPDEAGGDVFGGVGVGADGALERVVVAEAQRDLVSAPAAHHQIREHEQQAGCSRPHKARRFRDGPSAWSVFRARLRCSRARVSMLCFAFGNRAFIAACQSRAHTIRLEGDRAWVVWRTLASARWGLAWALFAAVAGIGLAVAAATLLRRRRTSTSTRGYNALAPVSSTAKRSLQFASARLGAPGGRPMAKAHFALIAFAFACSRAPPRRPRRAGPDPSRSIRPCCRSKSAARRDAVARRRADRRMPSAGRSTAGRPARAWRARCARRSGNTICCARACAHARLYAERHVRAGVLRRCGYASAPDAEPSLETDAESLRRGRRARDAALGRRLRRRARDARGTPEDRVQHLLGSSELLQLPHRRALHFRVFQRARDGDVVGGDLFELVARQIGAAGIADQHALAFALAARSASRARAARDRGRRRDRRRG